MTFSTQYKDIVEALTRIDPIAYGKNRNYLHGNVTRLSPYISRGMIHTKQVLEAVLSAGHAPEDIEKFIQELAWRDYWQQLWIVHGNEINSNLRYQDPAGKRTGIAKNITAHQTGIDIIDQQILNLYQIGYIHNHVRMYIASIACNFAHCAWLQPARWMYYHLLDGDWASNALSWQWVSGAKSNKQYYANQENINRFCHSTQRDTFLDLPYESFPLKAIPDILQEIEVPKLITPLPETPAPIIDPAKPTLIYNYYNLDPLWHAGEDANRILLLEPSVFKQYPVAEKNIAFCMQLAKDNIPTIQPYVAEFEQLAECTKGPIYFKEHPLNQYKGIKEPRQWMTEVQGDFPSFFAFWKKCKKEIFA
jgi:deoxyribodipyrimidine photo-lyase